MSFWCSKIAKGPPCAIWAMFLLLKRLLILTEVEDMAFLPCKKNPWKNQGCREPDSNRHDQCGQGILSPRCLPFHHLGLRSFVNTSLTLSKNQAVFKLEKRQSGMYVAFEPGRWSRISAQKSSYSFLLVRTQRILAAYPLSFGISA